MSLQSWCARVGTGDGADQEEVWTWGDRRLLFARWIAQIARATDVADLSLNDNFIFNVSFVSRSILSDGKLEMPVKLGLARDLASMVRRLPAQDSSVDWAILAFWDVAMPTAMYDSGIHPVLSDLARKRREEGGQTLGALIFDLLVEQLKQPVKIQQMSALHGLNHLGDPRTLELVARMSTDFADDEVRAFGAAAARFALP